VLHLVGLIKGDYLARGPKLLSITNLYTHTGKDAKQNLLIIDAEDGLLSNPSTLECVFPIVWGL
jgi:hypothetical protein